MEVNANAVLRQCQMCREDKEPMPVGNPLKKTDYKTDCCVCCVEMHVCVCRNCMFPWLEEYEGRMQTAEELTTVLQYVPKDERKVVCALCILSEEQGLQIVDIMSIEQKKRLIDVNKALDKHGDRPIMFTSMSLGYL